MYRVPAIDWVTMTGMAVLLGLVSAIAVYVPAWRAARLDPTVALGQQ